MTVEELLTKDPTNGGFYFIARHPSGERESIIPPVWEHDGKEVRLIEDAKSGGYTRWYLNWEVVVERARSVRLACKNCAYFRRPDSNVHGFCVRHAPIAIADHEEKRWPPTDVGLYCGDFEDRGPFKVNPVQVRYAVL